MRRLFGSLIVLAVCGTLVPAADPTPEDAIKMLDKMKVKYRKDKKTDKIFIVEFARKKVTDNDLKTLGALTSVRILNLEGPILKEVPGKVVYAQGQITDAGVKHLAGMTDLRELILSGTNVTDAGLKHLAGMKNLTTLSLNNTKVTDEGMQELTKLPKLQAVNLYDTKVSDTGVGVLKRWKSELKTGR